MFFIFSGAVSALDLGFVTFDLGLQKGNTPTQSQMRLAGRSALWADSRFVVDASLRWSDFDQSNGTFGYQGSLGHAFDLARNVRIVPSLGYETFKPDERFHWILLRNTIQLELREYIFEFVPMYSLNNYNGERAAAFVVKAARIFRGAQSGGSDLLGVSLEIYELMSESSRRGIRAVGLQFGRSF